MAEPELWSVSNTRFGVLSTVCHGQLPRPGASLRQTYGFRDAG